jgi:hypothetical protein
MFRPSINPDINPEELHAQFVNQGSVVIRNFLNYDYANQLSSFFTDEMSQNWWYSVSSPGTNGSVDFIRDFPENQERILIERNHSDSIFNTGGFSYHFYRTAGDHVQGCWCKECDFRNWLKSEEVLSFLSSVSGQEISNYNTLFASKYSEGCFLSPHHDESLGKMGFVLQLTKRWMPHWGGVLHFTNDQVTEIEYSESPTFNTLTLFHIPDGKGKFHYVSHVNRGVTSVRIAYSGWYN